MKTLLKVLGGIFVVLVLIGILVPDAKKDTGASNAIAATNTDAPVATNEVVDRPALEVLKSSETVNEFARTIHVKVRNNTDHLINYADLKGVYYNKKGDIVGTGIGNAANIAAGATKTIDIMSTGVENANKYEVEVGNVMD